MIRDGKSSQTMQKYLDRLEEALEYMENQKIDNANGSKKKPYKVFVTASVYREIKSYLDENDMYFCNKGEAFGWNKFIIIDQNQNDTQNLENNSYDNIRKQPNRKARREKENADVKNFPMGRIGHIDMPESKAKQNRKEFNKFLNDKYKNKRS